MATVAGARTAGVRLNTALALVVAVRPREWVKNTLVLAPLIFSGQLRPQTLLQAGATFAAFCAVSSAGYLVNDLRDVELDRRHPTKRFRPLASGALSAPTAVTAAVILCLVGVGLSLVPGWETTLLVVGYAALTFAYSYYLKHLVIIDVMTIAAGFLLRAIAGGVAISVAPSRWLLVCTGMVALFLGFTKRRQEAASELHSGQESRPVVEHYSLPFLDQMVSMVTAGTVISYAIYATNSPLVGDRMLATTPIVMYGVFRYLYLIYHCGDTRSTAVLLTRDRPLMATIVAFVATAGLLIYA
jgi:4-hydroxybenzoate polyprenyltransferase